MALQKTRPIRLKTPLGEDVLLLKSMTGSEQLGRLSQYELSVLSPEESVNIDDILGQNITVELEVAEDQTRYFNGYVSRFAQTGRSKKHVTYQVTVVPWLWFLTRRQDCRIFQEMTVPEIIKKVIADYPFADFDENLGSYRTRGYCVQYRETDYDFISRLMEEEGIYYYFTHEEGRHTAHFVDAYKAHALIPGYEEVPYFPPTENVIREDCVTDWAITREVVPGQYSLKDYDFWKPGVDLTTRSKVKRDNALADFEVYDYPGMYYKEEDGKSYARTRIEEWQARYEQAHGAGNARGFLPGGLFALTGHPREDQNREYLLTSVQYDMRTAQFESGDGEGDTRFSCRFSAIESKTPYRSPWVTGRPVVQGPQTAIVVGKSGEEIYTDKYGRVKVQFHWDRQGKNDENSSCWVRVASVWAGKAWGGIQIPRIGQEVIIDFLEGDPDRPIITGRVYNADQMPPYELPANQTRSGLKSRSSKGGAGENFNEISFEDKKGSEEMYIHAEKDQNVMIEHDQSRKVGNDQTLDVKHDRNEHVHNNRSLIVGVDKSESVGSNKSITVGSDHTEQIGGNMSQSVGMGSTETVAIGKALTIGAAYAVTVGAAMNVIVGAAKAEEVAGSRSVLVGGSSTEKVAGKKDVSIAGDTAITAGKNYGLAVKEKTNISSDKEMDIGTQKTLKLSSVESLVVQSDKDITIKSGSAQITLKKDGTIEIKGSKVNVKADGDVKIKGSSVALN